MTTQPMRSPTAEGVRRAADKIAAILPPTTLLPLEIAGTTIWCKAECLQPVGAFKIRGAWHRLTDLSEAERAAGVVGVSSGNHAQGVAWAARQLGIAATIVMPSDAPPVKIEGTRALGAEIVTYDRLTGNREQIARSLAEERGATLVHAFADPWVIEGQGSAGIEIARQMAERGLGEPRRIVAPCGGGGLSGGLALACPDAEIVPVEPEGWDDVKRSIAAGEIVDVGPNPPPTACDSLQPMATQQINFAIIKERCAYGLAVSPCEVEAAQRLAFQRLRLVVEPGGAAALAAVMAGKERADEATVVILSGGNTDPSAFAKVLTSGA